MNELLAKNENKAVEVFFEWKNSKNKAQEWLIANSFWSSTADVDNRKHRAFNKQEVVSLTKTITIEINYSTADPSIGSTKPKINFPPDNLSPKGDQKPWFKTISSLLKNYYETAGDLNSNKIHFITSGKKGAANSGFDIAPNILI